LAACVAAAFGGRPAWWAAASGALYAAAQPAGQRGFFGVIGGFQRNDIAAWQILSVLSVLSALSALSVLFVCAGAHYGGLRGRIAAMSPGLSSSLTCACLFVVPALYAAPDLAPEAAARIIVQEDRAMMRPEWLLRVLAACAAGAMVLISGARSAALANRAPRAWFDLSAQRRIGRHSIQVFTLQVVVMAAVQQVDAGAPGAREEQALGLLAFLTFAALAWSYRRWRESGARA
jgi:hypothetical protein